MKMEAMVRVQEERMKNPFYTTLKAQKEERDKFVDFYSSGILLGLPAIPSPDGAASPPKTVRSSNNEDVTAEIENGEVQQ